MVVAERLDLDSFGLRVRTDDGSRVSTVAHIQLRLIKQHCTACRATQMCFKRLGASHRMRNFEGIFEVLCNGVGEVGTIQVLDQSIHVAITLPLALKHIGSLQVIQ